MTRVSLRPAQRGHATSMTISRRSYRFFLNAVALVAFVGIGGMQMYHVNGGVITSYGADLLAPPILYFSFREGYRIPRAARVWRLGPMASLLTVFSGCALWEWSQRHDFSGTPLAIAAGRFDPLDLLAYAVGLLISLVVDVRLLVPRRITWHATP